MGIKQAGNDRVFHMQGFTIRMSQIQGVSPVRRRVGWASNIYYDFEVLLRNRRYPNKAFILQYPSKFEAISVRAAIRATWFKYLESRLQDKEYQVVW